MAGNFWQSSHCAQWILDKADLLRERHADLQVLTEEEYQKIIIFYANFIQVKLSLVLRSDFTWKTELLKSKVEKRIEIFWKWRTISNTLNLIRYERVNWKFKTQKQEQAHIVNILVKLKKFWFGCQTVPISDTVRNPNNLVWISDVPFWSTKHVRRIHIFF